MGPTDNNVPLAWDTHFKHTQFTIRLTPVFPAAALPPTWHQHLGDICFLLLTHHLAIMEKEGFHCKRKGENKRQIHGTKQTIEQLLFLGEFKFFISASWVTPLNPSLPPGSKGSGGSCEEQNMQPPARLTSRLGKPRCHTVLVISRVHNYCIKTIPLPWSILVPPQVCSRIL